MWWQIQAAGETTPISATAPKECGSSIEPGIGTPAQELHHIVTIEMTQSAVHQLGIDARQARLIPERISVAYSLSRTLQ
jgi:hypothetical protein